MTSPHQQLTDEIPVPPSLRNKEIAAPVRRVRKRRWPRVLASIVALAFFAVLGGVAYSYWQAQQIVNEFQAGDKKQVVEAVAPELNVAPTNPTPGLGEAQVFLLIGADKRHGESGNGRSDTMILTRIDPDTKSVSMLSIPRDLYVPIPGYGYNKINAAYSLGGEQLLVRTIREYFGVKINHFVEVDFGSFNQLVETLGGVYIPVDGRYYHVNDGSYENNWSSIDLQPGYQKLNSEQALQFVRFRHLDSDFYRAGRQQLFIREVGRQLKQRVRSVTSLPDTARMLAKAVTSDLDSVSETLRLANTLRAVPPERIRRYTLPAESTMISGVYYLQVTPEQKVATLQDWAAGNPAQERKRLLPHRKRPEARGQQTSTGLIADGGSGRSLLAPLNGIDRCAPTALPSGYSWGDLSPARRYQLDGHPAIAAWASAGSGRSLLWMWTTWQDPPILQSPSEIVIRDGREYELWRDSGRTRQIAWRLGETRVWITNTLRNEISNSTMMALATSCKPL